MDDECEGMTSVNIERSSSKPKWLIRILIDSSQNEKHQPPTKPRIHQVPEILRDVNKNKECFDPMVVSFGPHHHGNPKLAMLEKLKIKIAKQLILGRDLKEFYEFDEVAHDAREFYDKESTAPFSDAEFVRMMFLDSCLLIHLMDCINQIPFVVLRALLSFNITGNEGEEMIHKFIKNHIVAKSCHSVEKLDNPAHLLDLLRNELVGAEPQLIKSPQEFDNWQSFRSVTELRDGGIECKKSCSSSFKAISFKTHSFHGDLFLPSIVVDDSTKSMLLNLVAYEACSDFPNDYAVTSYICFMDALIDHAEDVKELRSKGILLNLLGSDEQVADLFNDLAINLAPNPNEYLEVKGSIERYYKKKRIVWMTEMMSTYFSSPWTAFGFFVAMAITLLTFVQTYFQVFPPKDSGGGD
ncbi:hypothetical protein NE237_002822 [Protea cynaroides]|uniref:Uncharacterized protein n=1 Tax=Protea cynaroides TaxID=273540 RepID=A0A9Q0KFJ7_9MAGN|nr:hypothetical protein NE237_002822 [Protea cynaroides]